MTIFWKELTRLSGSKEKRNYFLTNVQWSIYVFTTKFRFIVHDKVTRQNRDPYIPECRLTTANAHSHLVERKFGTDSWKMLNVLRIFDLLEEDFLILNLLIRACKR